MKDSNVKCYTPNYIRIGRPSYRTTHIRIRYLGLDLFNLIMCIYGSGVCGEIASILREEAREDRLGCLWGRGGLAINEYLRYLSCINITWIIGSPAHACTRSENLPFFPLQDGALPLKVGPCFPL
jgi:hypothetical protein